MTFIKHISLTAVTSLALFAVDPAAADDYARAPASETSSESGAPAMWKITDEDTTIYMFGTVHMLPADVNWKTELVTTALKSADTLVTELNMTPETEAAIGLEFQKRGTLPEGTTLRSLMTDEQLTKFEAGMAKIQVPPQAFDPLKPWLASFALLQGVSASIGTTPENGVETVLESMIGPDVKREALETIGAQLDVFDGLPMDQQMVYFLDFAADPIEGIKGLNALVDLWAKGDADGVGKLMNEGLRSDPVLADRLLYNRNRNWADWIDERMETPGIVFMAVGAGHLAGEKSVQAYLNEQGIQSVRVQ